MVSGIAGGPPGDEAEAVPRLVDQLLPGPAGGGGQAPRRAAKRSSTGRSRS